MRTTNPILNDNVFDAERTYSAGEVMTVQGTVNKSLVLLGLVVLSASWVWGKFFSAVEQGIVNQGTMSTLSGAMMIGAIVGFIFAMITAFKHRWASFTAPIYALFEGLFLGGISAFFEVQYPGIVLQAVGLTFGTLFCMLMAYKTGFIQPTQKFRTGLIAATGGIALFYFIVLILGFFGVQVPFIFGSGPIGIGFSLFVVGIAALNLVLDFDFIENGAQMGVPKYMEWYGAFGLLVTLVWLYVEILRLLSKLRRR
jgi:uncharacterized YccA/Bax inhibitor family protein